MMHTTAPALVYTKHKTLSAHPLYGKGTLMSIRPREVTKTQKESLQNDSNHRDLSLRYLLFHRGVAVAAMSTQQREQKNEKAKPEKP